MNNDLDGSGMQLGIGRISSGSQGLPESTMGKVVEVQSVMDMKYREIIKKILETSKITKLD
jgi:hypothetical protein